MQLPTETEIVSHRTGVGWLIVAYKKLIRFLIAPYLRNVFEKEHQLFTTALAEAEKKIIDELVKRLDSIIIPLNDKDENIPNMEPEKIESYNKAAELFFQRKDAPRLINKPFNWIGETPTLLYSLGIALSNLDIGINHTILDFGAGPCWVSSCLNRMGCKTISMDISATALEIGKKLFELDKRHKMHLKPEFLTYDGHHFPIENESADRIICFDAFHHVPNPQDILNEMFRVLKYGGKAAFSEPGVNHSQTPQSIFEMQEYGTLENNFIIKEFYKMAMRAGFTKCFIKPYPLPGSITFDMKMYSDFLIGNDKVFPIHTLRQDMQICSFVILQKGEDVYDSRSPRILSARIFIIKKDVVRQVKAGEELVYHLEITNIGDTIWLSTYCQEGGFVRLGGHLLDSEGKVAALDYHRTFLDHDVLPNKNITVVVRIKAPLQRGVYFIEFDMINEGITWFARHGAKTEKVKFIVE
ncbi:MAG: class I SAM-dependent methyltransferase [Nitrospirae bacterium]|nr:class I SAM-dependent methyltransferase [Nitrospirota bacterium]